MADLTVYKCECGCRGYVVLDSQDDRTGYTMFSLKRDVWLKEDTDGMMLSPLSGNEADRLIASFVAWRLVEGDAG
jgi:hypothetical protein